MNSPARSVVRSRNSEVIALAGRLRQIVLNVERLGGGDMSSLVRVGPENYATCADIQAFLDQAAAFRKVAG